jgi:DNA-binding CsgD family transcriptional regulator
VASTDGSLALPVALPCAAGHNPLEVMSARAVIGRDEELVAVKAFLGRIEDGPCALVLSGEAGIGKTVLWETGVAKAQERGVRVLVGRGTEAEALLSFAGLSDLLAPVFDDVVSSLLAPRRRALEVALLRVEPGEEAPDAHAIGLAVLDALGALAEQGPVLVALDDLQWFDPASAGAIQIALRRLRAEQVGLLATLRTGAELAVPLELGRSYSEDRIEHLTIGPLSLGAVHDLLQERLGLELTRPELARVQEATAGNPFFALEVGRELVRTNTRPVPGQALRVPDSLRELLGGRLDRLPSYAGDVLLQVAALARPTLDLVTAAHGERERVLKALEAAAHEGVVELDDSRIRFSHPLLASLCYEQAPVWKRRAVHRALADAVSDVEECARHLALAAEGPDAVVASSLDAAAEAAAARGAPAAAADLAELAAELTRDDPPLARHRRLRSARFRTVAGERERAIAMLEQLRAEAPSGVERADVLIALASALISVPTKVIELCDEALAEATGDDTRSARVLTLRSTAWLQRAEIPAALVDGRAAVDRAERTGDPALMAVAIARTGHAEMWAADITSGLLERGAEIEERQGLQLEVLDSPRWLLARRLLRQGEIERARTILEECERTALARGDENDRALVGWNLALVEWLTGRWPQALDRAIAAHEVAEVNQLTNLLLFAGRVKGLIEADLGLIEEARASAEEGLAVAEATGAESFVVLTLGVLGRLELALGNLEKAGHYLRELPRRLLAGGLNDPTQPLWADTIETLIALGELEQAHSYLEACETNARRLGSPLAMEGVHRCRGLLAAADGNVAEALADFELAIAEQPSPPWVFERARTLLCRGSAYRQAQQKRVARDAIGEALAIFEEVGAPLWVGKAQAELRRISGRPAASEELTETERRVAELAARGRTNKQIAAALFMGVSTVESHLSHVYRKLGVRRAELAARLATPQGAPAKAGGEPVQT